MHSSSPMTSTSTILMAVAAVIPVTQARYLWHPNEVSNARPLIRDFSLQVKGEPLIVNHLAKRQFANAETTGKADEASTKKESSPTAAKSSSDPKPTSNDSKPSAKETKSAAPTSSQKPSPTKSKEETSKAASTHAASASSSGAASSSPTDTSSASGLLPSASNSSSLSSPSSSSAADSSGGGTSSGAVAGIVIGILAVVGAIAAFVMMRRKKRTRRSPNPDPFTMGFGSHDPPSAYNNTTTAPSTGMAQTYHHDLPQAVHMPPISPTYSTPPPPLSPMSDVPPYQQQQYYATAPVSEKSQVPLATAAAGAMGVAAATNNNNNNEQPPLQQAGGQQQPTEATHQGSLGVFNVVSTYSPTLSDEIDIQLGDRIEILVEYDDGWCQGVNLSRGNAKGVFPRHCVEQHAGEQQPPKNDGPPQLELGSLKRVSSMYMAYS